MARLICPKCGDRVAEDQRKYHEEIECPFAPIPPGPPSPPPEPPQLSPAEHRRRYKMRFGKYPEEDED